MSNLSARLSLVAFLVAGTTTGSLMAQGVQVRARVAESLPRYQAGPAITGTLEIPCTDALSDLGDEWSRAFKKLQPGGSLVFLPALSKDAVKRLQDGSSTFIIIARELLPEENQTFQARFGYLPMRIPVCMDANIVFVNKANPLTFITMEQLDAIYSRNRLGGAQAPLLVWGDLGVKGELARRVINAYSRAEGTATRSSFATMAMLNGPFRAGIIDREDSSSLAEAISTDMAGIAFGPMASWYATNKTLPVVPFHGTEARYPTQDMVTASKYPMPRMFYGYLNRAPGKVVDPAVNEALHFILAQEGQNQVADVGLLPGPVEFMTIALKRLNR